MPDHLAKPGAYAGTAHDQDDSDLEHERAWLGSSLRCFLDDGCENNAPKQETQYRLPAYWWLVLIDCFVLARTTQGSEALSSPQTARAAAKLLSAAEALLHRAILVEKSRSSRWPFRWLGLLGDQCSVGVCGLGFGKKVLRLLIEGSWDPAHRVNNDIVLGMRFAGEFYVMLVMKAIPPEFGAFSIPFRFWGRVTVYVARRDFSSIHNACGGVIKGTQPKNL